MLATSADLAVDTARFVPAAPPVRILVHTGTLDCCNVGDLAMLQACTTRLAALWPSTDIAVISSDAARLRRHCPDVRSVAAEGFGAWTSDRYLMGRVDRRLPDVLARRLIAFSRGLRRRWPTAAARAIAARGWLFRRDVEPVHAFLDELHRADLLVATGQGTLTDAARADAIGLLAFIEGGAARHIPAAMPGQGVGPIESPALRARASEVLRSVDMIGVRERRSGPALLHSLGVPDDRVMLTGDDAVEQAFRARQAGLGPGIGLNLRIADAAAVHASWIGRLRPVFHSLARRRRAPLLPLPISNHPTGTRDSAVLRELLSGFDGGTDSGESLDTAAAVIEQAGRCRVVITGAYHAAVFSLAQGIPTICLGASRYVLDKMYGLEDLFGGGCRVVELTDESAAEAIVSAADALWESAERLRPDLLASAQRQIALGRAGYARIGTLVTHRSVPAAELKV